MPDEGEGQQETVLEKEHPGEVVGGLATWIDYIIRIRLSVVVIEYKVGGGSSLGEKTDTDPTVPIYPT